jgi:hypothetical protein
MIPDFLKAIHVVHHGTVALAVATESVLKTAKLLHDFPEALPQRRFPVPVEKIDENPTMFLTGVDPLP